MGKIQAISETFMHDMGGGGAIQGMTDDGNPIMAAPEDVPQTEEALQQQQGFGPGETTGRGTRGRQASTPGAAHIAERVRELATMTGIYTTPPAGSYTRRDHAPTPNRREQK